MSAKLINGNQHKENGPRPVADSTAGTVIAHGDTAIVLSVDFFLEQKLLPAYAWPNGSATYRLTKAASASVVFTGDEEVFYDTGTQLAVEGPAGGTVIRFGRRVMGDVAGGSGGADADDYVDAVHERPSAPISYIPGAAQQTLAAGGGAVTVTEFYTAAATDAGGDAWTLADGVEGQLKKIQLVTDGGGDGTLTPTNLSGGTTITFADVGDFVLLKFAGGSWVPIELGNDADGVTAPVLA